MQAMVDALALAAAAANQRRLAAREVEVIATPETPSEKGRLLLLLHYSRAKS